MKRERKSNKIDAFNICFVLAQDRGLCERINQAPDGILQETCYPVDFCSWWLDSSTHVTLHTSPVETD
jgi:hypothetical protein